MKATSILATKRILKLAIAITSIALLIALLMSFGYLKPPVSDANAFDINEIVLAVEGAATDEGIDKQPDKKDDPKVSSKSIDESKIPLGSAPPKYEWSLVSLIIGCASLFLALLTFFMRSRGHPILKLIPILIGCVPILLFFVFDDVETKMTLVNHNTPPIVVVFVVHIAATIMTRLLHISK